MRLELLEYCTNIQLDRVIELYKKGESNLRDPFRRMNPHKAGLLVDSSGKSRLVVVGGLNPKGAFVVTYIHRNYKINDIAGFCLAEINVPFVRVESLVYEGHDPYGLLVSITQKFGQNLVLEFNMEDKSMVRFIEAVGFRRITSKVTAFADIIGVYVLGTVSSLVNFETMFDSSGYSCADMATCHLLDFWKGELDVHTISNKLLDKDTQWPDHYSNYNEDRSWSSLTLKGFGGRHDFLIKPAEMPRKWKNENPDKMQWKCENTPLMWEFPEVSKICGMIPGEKERIRFMKLSAGSGTLGRHTDKSDKSLGITVGRIIRIHVPIITNKRVEFTSWDLEGIPHKFRMGRGRAYFLDIYKPHMAINNGKKDRIHLVIDTIVTPQLHQIIKATILRRLRET